MKLIKSKHLYNDEYNHHSPESYPHRLPTYRWHLLNGVAVVEKTGVGQDGCGGEARQGAFLCTQQQDVAGRHLGQVGQAPSNTCAHNHSDNHILCVPATKTKTAMTTTFFVYHHQKQTPKTCSDKQIL